MTPQRVGTDQLAALLDLVGPLWSARSSATETGVHDGYRQVTIVHAGRLAVPGFAEVLAQFAPVHGAWLSGLAPGGFIAEHIDAGPYWERWQLPFTTAGCLLQCGAPVHHEVGVPFRVAHHDWHSVINTDDTERVALVIDRAVPLSIPSAPLQVRNIEEGRCLV
jgi:hypothetical protein